MLKKNTGSMLSEVRGPLNNLLINLSGEHSLYWLTALKKMLRKEPIPEPSIEIQNLNEALNSREDARDKINEWVVILNSIPTVEDAELDDETGDVINLGVYPSATAFLSKWKECYLFCLGIDGTVRCVGEPIGDEIFNAWYINKENFVNLQSFVKALLDLGIAYRNSFTSLHDGEIKMT